jgi:hypothetical protein
MKLFNKIIATTIAISLSALILGCQPTPEKPLTNSNSVVEKPAFTKVDVGGAKSPAEAYTMLYTAVKAGDIESVKKMLSKSSIGMGESAGQRQNKSIDEVVKNGFTATTFSDTLPEIRDPRVKDNYASIEVRNEKENKWEDLPFVLEDGSWKLAVGDLFAGAFQSPGMSKATTDQINANKSNPNAGMIKGANSNTNTAKINVIKPEMPPEMRKPEAEKK